MFVVNKDEIKQKGLGFFHLILFISIKHNIWAVSLKVLTKHRHPNPPITIFFPLERRFCSLGTLRESIISH